MGLLSGLLGGVSSLTGPVIITYLSSLRLSREQFVGTISVIYLFGMATGKHLRYLLSEAVFRKLLLGFLVIVAIALVFK